MKNVSKTLLVAASFFALASTAIGGKALAQAPTTTELPPQHLTTDGLVAFSVRYSDLDVSKMQGAKILYLRIRHAAETVCESAATWGKKEGETCVNKAVNDAVAHINAPLLTEYNQRRSKGEKAALVQFAKAN